MCIAIYKPAEKSITKDTLKTCFTNNPDGAGFSYINTDYMGISRMKIKKYMKFDDFWRAYSKAIDIAPNSPFLIHFRIGTHGEKTTYNCHPFFVNKELTFIHNGIISGVGTDKRKSDTQLFNDKVLKKLPKGWQYNEGIQTLVESFIGGSKLIMMDINGDVTIFNENKGVWDNDCWYSNESYKPRTPVVYAGVYRGRSRQNWWEYDQQTVEECDMCTSQRSLKWLDIYKDPESPSEFVFICQQCKRSNQELVGGLELVSTEAYLAQVNAERKALYGTRDYRYDCGYMM